MLRQVRIIIVPARAEKDPQDTPSDTRSFSSRFYSYMLHMCIILLFVSPRALRDIMLNIFDRLIKTNPNNTTNGIQSIAEEL